MSGRMTGMQKLRRCARRRAGYSRGQNPTPLVSSSSLLLLLSPPSPVSGAVSPVDSLPLEATELPLLAAPPLRFSAPCCSAAGCCAPSQSRGSPKGCRKSASGATGGAAAVEAISPGCLPDAESLSSAQSTMCRQSLIQQHLPQYLDLCASCYAELQVQRPEQIGDCSMAAKVSAAASAAPRLP
jgi:hypothetical protein